MAIKDMTPKQMLELLAETDLDEAKRVVRKLVQEYGFTAVAKKYGHAAVWDILNS